MDRENYPRADIDVYAVRKARNTVICEGAASAPTLLHLPPSPGLRNDHKAVMGLIEQKLYQLHAEARERGVVTAPGGEQERRKPTKTFASVTSVAPGSPAADAVSTE